MSDVEIKKGDTWVNKLDETNTVTLATVGAFSVTGSSTKDGSYMASTHDFLHYFKPQPKEQGRKDDSAKIRYSLLPVGTVNQVVQVLEFGSKKYADNNWQKVPSARTRYYDAAMRHIDAWWNGELLDLDKGDQKGSHLPHLAHAICCLMFLMWFDSEAADD